jgi:hypothetical protein
MFRVDLALVLLLASGCAASTPPAARTADSAKGDSAERSSSGRRAEVLLEAPITYSVPAKDGKREIHTPLVRARIGEVERLFILDSGATDPIFTKALAKSVGMNLKPAEQGSDHAGAKVRTFQGTSPLTVVLESYPYKVAEPLFIEGPPPFERWGIGGFLSPQLLAGEGWVEMDLRQQRLRIVEGSRSAVARKVAARNRSLQRTALQRVRVKGDRARLLLVEGRIEGQPIRVYFNTGTQTTELAPSTPVANSASTDEVVTGQGVSGEAVKGTRSSGPAALSLGEAEVQLDEFVVREQGEGTDGQLGTDLLRGTVLLMRAEPATGLYWWHP